MHAPTALRSIPLLALAGVALCVTATVSAPARAQPDQTPAPRALPVPPAFARQPVPIPQPAPSKPPPDQARHAPGDGEPPPPMHGRVAPGFDLETVMREVGSPGATCVLGFNIANIGDESFDTIMINLSIVLRGGSASRSSIFLQDTLEPEHSVATTLEVATPCDGINEVRLLGFSRCTIDAVPMGTCRPPMLMRSDSRIRFGL